MGLKQPIDICMFVHNHVTSDSRVLKEATSLTEHGWKVRVVGIPLDGKDYPAREVVNGFEVVRVQSRFLRRLLPGTLGKLLRLSLASVGLAYQLRAANARVYHANDFPGLVMMALAGIWRRPVVYDSHELFFDRWLPGPGYSFKYLWWSLRPIEKFLARRAARVITASEESAEEMARTMGIPLPVALLNAVDLRHLGPAAAVYDTGGRRTIVHSGNLAQMRNLEQLVTALTYLPDDVAVVLMGDGRLKASLLQQAKDLNVADRLFIVPPVPSASVAPTLAQADAAVVLVATKPLHYDLTMANKFFEAVAAGLPLISSPTTAAARFMQKWDLGLLCDPNDPRAIADAILTILQPENLARYRANAERARAVLNWENEEHKLIGVYEALL
jgi:glycogen(starch) synthase